METIYKYELKSRKEVLMLPTSAQFLSVQLQGSVAVVWVKLDPLLKPVEITVESFETGTPMFNYKNLNYMGTVQWYNGEYVLHYFWYIKS